MLKMNDLVFFEMLIKRYAKKLFKLKSKNELAKMFKMNDLVYFEKLIKAYVKNYSN